MQTNFVNVRDAAAELGISPRAVLHRITRGELRATKVGDGRTSAYIIAREDVEAAKTSPADRDDVQGQERMRPHGSEWPAS